MLGVKLQREMYWRWVYAGFLSVAVGIMFAIWLGPVWVYGAAAAGFLLAIAATVTSLSAPATHPSGGWGLSIAGLHIVLLIAAFVLQTLFLQPMANQQLKVPSFGHDYADPQGAFSLKGPSYWDYTPVVSRNESGVLIRPVRQDDYMGISEIKILIRRLDPMPSSPDKFLLEMASGVSARDRSPAKKKYFKFSSEPLRLLNGERGVLSTLDIDRLWVPLRQVCLFGIKSRRYLCSISATGLKSHSTLSRVMCLGLMESLRVESR